RMRRVVICFVSSRRRHTRFSRDWSSDVCSSDLATLTLPFLTYVLPRRMESLHPGAEGNPAFSEMDIAPEMRWVFYAAVVGFFLLFGWVYTARVRMRRAELLAEARHSLPRSSGEAALA